MNVPTKIKNVYTQDGIEGVLHSASRAGARNVYNTAKPGLAWTLRSSHLSLDRHQLKNNAERWIPFGEEKTFQPPKPKGPKPAPSELSEKNRALLDPKPFVCDLSDVELVGQHQLPLDSEGRYILEGAEGRSDILADTITSTVFEGHIPLRRGKGHHYTESSASLIGIWCNEFFHWFADYLPQIRGIETYEDATGNYPNIFIPKDGPSWQRESLSLLGVPDERITEWEGGRVQIETFVIPALPHPTEINEPPWGYAHSPQAQRWVSNRIQERFDIQNQSQKRILITRRKAGTRRLYNEQEVINALAKYGFEPVVLTELPLLEQIKTFAKAEAVVGPHGAGLINTIYSKDISILELFGDYINACYYCLAGGHDFTYRYDLCEDINGDLNVNTNSLETAVQKLLD